MQAVVNGEIYGHAVLRRLLEREGARFVTSSDCEVVLHGYQRHGRKFLQQLNGEFAGVIWDARSQNLLAFRDRWGVKPLFYAPCSDGLLLASEAKALFAMGHAPRWDRANLFQHFFASIGPSQSLFAGVAQVRPGHLLEWDGRSLRSEPLRPPSVPCPLRDAAPQQMAKLRSALDSAVVDRLQGDARIACYLSGGVDSTTVASIAAQHDRANIEAFTVDFGDGVESAQAAATAAALGLKHHVVPVRPADLVAHFDSTVRHAETVGFNAIGSARWLIGSVLAQHGFKVVLVGDGSDELFGGYSFSVMDSLCLRSPQQAAWAMQVLETGRRAFLAELGIDEAPFDLSAFGGDEPVPYLLASWNQHRADMRMLLAPELLLEQRGLNPFERLGHDIGLEALQQRRGLQRSMYLWQQSLFANHILVAERLDMAHGIESRYPFLDDRVAEVALGLPDDWLVHDLREKRLLRQAVSALLPPSSGRTDKRPFAAPLLCAGDDAAFADYLRDSLDSPGMRHSGVLDAKAVARLVDALPQLSFKSRQRVDSVLMMSLSFVALQRCFDVAA